MYQVPEFIVMADIESLDTGPRSVITQIGLTFSTGGDPETEIGSILLHLPVQAQLSLKRTISADTIWWWFQQDEKARKEFQLSLGNDFEELPSLMRSLIRKWHQYIPVGTDPKSIEVWARGPQFDIANIESLADDLALEVPWRYDRVRDLRTLMAVAGISTSDVVRPPELTEHMATMDCRFQTMCMVEAFKRNAAARA